MEWYQNYLEMIMSLATIIWMIYLTFPGKTLTILTCYSRAIAELVCKNSRQSYQTIDFDKDLQHTCL